MTPTLNTDNLAISLSINDILIKYVTLVKEVAKLQVENRQLKAKIDAFQKLSETHNFNN